jgi:hypothetical protein
MTVFLFWSEQTYQLFTVCAVINVLIVEAGGIGGVESEKEGK